MTGLQIADVVGLIEKLELQDAIQQVTKSCIGQ
jgi:hypothetical protein